MTRTRRIIGPLLKLIVLSNYYALRLGQNYCLFVSRSSDDDGVHRKITRGLSRSVEKVLLHNLTAERSKT